MYQLQRYYICVLMAFSSSCSYYLMAFSLYIMSVSIVIFLCQVQEAGHQAAQVQQETEGGLRLQCSIQNTQLLLLWARFCTIFKLINILWSSPCTNLFYFILPC